MASDLTLLQSVLSPDPAGSLRVLGGTYTTSNAEVSAWAQRLAALDEDEWEEAWPALRFELFRNPATAETPQSDAKLILLYAHYIVMVRGSGSTGTKLPPHMVTWLGRGHARVPAENSTWFLGETEGFGAEGARDVVNVMGGETTFLAHFLGDGSDAAVLEQAGIYLAMLFHLRAKWPAYFEWMPMNERLQNIRDLFLNGSEELAVLAQKGKTRYVPRQIVKTYEVIAKTMYQVPFFVELRKYVNALKKNDGLLEGNTLALYTELLKF